ncbi:hypothetical protein TRFO_05067 [Tritrichomonas foetus]|uniref:Uncharacterized protein n=1 Tax=Tritrichomonas foetus TaxID=1144522 RepID=A0A1J4K8X0_9EUKA|nr:hypothetical protein TRFO_05067 [Tritrichomonas foetus]|eukprot:OHT07945.1 hypothetical protein TRFO_05067 [Tritrichomonas foetus]
MKKLFCHLKRSHLMNYKNIEKESHVKKFEDKFDQIQIKHQRDENLCRFNFLLDQLYSMVKSNDLTQFKDCYQEIHLFLNSKRNDDIFQIILDKNFVGFLIEQISNNYSDIIFEIISLSCELFLFNREEVINMFLDSNCLPLFHEFLNSDRPLLDKVINLIGYATFDLFKYNKDWRFSLNLDRLDEILNIYPDLYPNVMYLVFNSFSVDCFDNISLPLSFYLLHFTVEHILMNEILFNPIPFFDYLTTRIQNFPKFPLHILLDTKFLPDKIYKFLFPSDELQFYCMTNQRDLVFWALKLIAATIENDESFINKLFLQADDLYKIIRNCSSSDKTVAKALKLLGILLENGKIGVIDDLKLESTLKTGKKNIFNYNAYFESSFVIKKWYLRFIHSLLSFGGQFEEIKIFYSRDFIEVILDFLEPDTKGISKSVLLVLDSILQRAIKEKFFGVLEILASDEVNNLLEEFSDKTMDEELDELVGRVMRSISEAQSAYNQTPPE